MSFSFKEIISVTIILFSVIDILGSIPVIIDLRKKAGDIHAEQATLVAGTLMIVYLFLGISILNLFGVDVKSFAVAGAIIIFLIGMEMILGRNIFKHETSSSKATSIVPLAFPIIAGAGTMTTIISLKAAYAQENIIVGILLNLLIVYLVLKTSVWIENKLGQTGVDILRKVFGMILLAIAIKLIKANLV
ncbi:MarC family protein [Emticicia sp. C21]|uniref:MarC family protein n=1 Tax=Emticicia sp. C21 TaxID=2302915 RepID=UPI000E348E5B|nr:MarC family protein [Emticicia sp. C21]RFS13743.1 MarC family protein [Emticicia sp. C21]